MGTKSGALAKQFVAKAQEAVAVLERLSEADWKQVTAAERWTVGVTAHHLASAFEPVAGIVTAIVSGQSGGHLTRAMLDEMNARHAQEHANCTKAETIALFRRGAATAAWLRLTPATEASHAVVGLYGGTAAGCAAIERVVGSGLVPAALEYLAGGTLAISSHRDRPAAFTEGRTPPRRASTGLDHGNHDKERYPNRQ